jgi:hypothetical protein
LGRSREDRWKTPREFVGRLYRRLAFSQNGAGGGLSDMDERVRETERVLTERVKRPKFLLTTEQFNHHFSQDQFVIKLRGNQLNICFETRPHRSN